ncbi:D-alanyl-D-alanine carboxypeptidase family protein [Actomonas aquatica]|uniref:D-alanyl-D-alanine carboxypeptidase family protein n=1 Tax=Actomonas aquatica TaxID=2866162 RepID=A0ABZ1CAH4_9BACT|nr:D-alanyl-D-alanine carboxypeptidase family protein [Opitutus sp. WL0086]WRQ88676.1 D-alanyl-D-alanine carboxypeptidase family protein [Opitutus sp. WL0086]
MPAAKTLLISLLLTVVTTVSAQVYKGAILLDASTGEVLFEDRSDYVGPPASVTKLMTYLVVHDMLRAGELTLQTPVEVTAEDSRMGGTQVWLKHREVFPVDELLYALLIQSANDAAHALSHAAGISREEFVARMNARAQQLGMTDTIWRSPHGLPPSSRRRDESDLTSPRDLAKLSLALLRETEVLRYTSIERRPFGQGVRAKPVMMDNHNNLIGKVRGVDGLKTGFTRAAGFCLAATAQREGRRIIAVIMGSPTSKERDIKMAELIEETFAKMPAATGPFQPLPPEPMPVSAAAHPIQIEAAPEAAATPAAAPEKSEEIEVPHISITPLAPEEDAAPPAEIEDDKPTVEFRIPN